MPRVSRLRTFHSFTHKEAAFRMCTDHYGVVTQEIVEQRRILEEYIARHQLFHKSLVPVDTLEDAPESAKRMANAAKLVGVGPMAAVAGTMAQLAGEAALHEGAQEVIIENGGDIYLRVVTPIRIGLHTGTKALHNKLAFAVEPEDTPLAICSSSSKMGHSMSLGNCDLATVVAKDTALADAAATQAANLVREPNDIDQALETIGDIEGILGVLITKDDTIGLAGRLPELVKVSSPDTTIGPLDSARRPMSGL